MWSLTTQSQESSPRKVIFFDPISAGLYEEATENNDKSIDIALGVFDRDQVVLHNWPNANGTITELIKPEVTNWGDIEHGQL